jgi:hypothetical protein
LLASAVGKLGGGSSVGEGGTAAGPGRTLGTGADRCTSRSICCCGIACGPNGNEGGGSRSPIGPLLSSGAVRGVCGSYGGSVRNPLGSPGGTSGEVGGASGAPGRGAESRSSGCDPGPLGLVPGSAGRLPGPSGPGRSGASFIRGATAASSAGGVLGGGAWRSSSSAGGVTYGGTTCCIWLGVGAPVVGATGLIGQRRQRVG